jgi:hypothetical protein
MKFIDLPITTEIERFRIHLNQLNNSRIIFSGIFGIGKTYFIQKFFESETNYISIRINPVNYSVSQSQDIFELIKYDIAFQLLSKNPDFEKTNFNKFFTGQYYILENYKNIISDLVENLSKIDQQINAIVEPAFKLGKKIEEYHAKINKDEEKELIDFLTFFKDKNGTIKEENNITELLSVLISTLKKEGKKVVLIIDDLDRIDPEHIFRLLNVFSAHFDFQELEGENKFGFDKVILICDIDNIRGIFHNKYGAEIDFSGYIDKFYSNEIIYYRIENVIKEYLKHFLKSIKSSDKSFTENLKLSNSYIQSDLQFLLSFFIDCNTISLRKLFSFLNQEISFPNYKFQFNKSTKYPIYSNSTPVLFVIETLEKLFGNKSNFLNAIDKVIDKFPLVSLERYGNFTDSSIGNMAMIAGYAETQLIPSENSEVYTYEILGYQVEYRIDTYNQSYGVTGYTTKISSSKSNGDSTEIINNYILPYFQLLKAAYIAKNEIVKKHE